MKVTAIAKETSVLLGLMITSAAIDGWAPTLFAGHSLVLGQVVYWLALQRLGLLRALFPLMASIAVLWIKWQQPYSALTVGLESVLVGMAWRKKRSPFLADIAYWLLLGFPLTWITYRYILVLPDPVLGHAIVVQMINGFIAVWTARVIENFLPQDAREERGTGEGLARFISKRYITVGVFPLLAAAIFAIRIYESTSFNESKDNLRTTAMLLEAEIGGTVDRGVTGIKLIASHLAQLPQASAADERLLKEIIAQDAAIVAARRIGIHGDIIASVPQMNPVWETVPAFAYALSSGDSRVNLSSKVGYLPGDDGSFVLSVSCPIVDLAGVRLGSVEVLLSINAIASILSRGIKDSSWRASLVDDRLRIVTASKGAETSFISLNGTGLARLIENRPSRPVRYVDHTASYPVIKIVSIHPIRELGWHLVVERSWSGMLQPVTYFFLITIATAAASGVVIAFSTAWSVRGLFTAHRALSDFATQPVASAHALRTAAQTTPDIPSELRATMINLASTADALRTEQNRTEELVGKLEERVVQRTLQLNEALVAAKAADRAKSVFLATVSHELRTPLTSIISSCAILKRADSASSGMQSRTLASLDRSSNALLQLISNVLDFSKIEAGAMTVARETFKPATIIKEVESILGPEAHAAGLDFRCEIGVVDHHEWIGDPDRLRQILLNLVSNAIKYTNCGWVAFSAAVVEADGSRPRGLRFLVSDSGLGIPEAHAEDVFRPFFRLQGGHHRYPPSR